MQSCDQGAGGAILEIGQGQSEQVPENLATENRIDTVAGVQHKVLAQPAHTAGEEHEYDQGYAKNDQGAMGLVNDDLVDDDLGEQRGSQTDELDGEAGKQYVTPDGLVLEQFGDEPRETECHGLGFKAGNLAFLVGAAGFAGGKDQFGLKLAGCIFDAEGFRSLGTGSKVEKLVAIGFENEDRNDGDGFLCSCFRHGAQESDSRERQLLPVGWVRTMAGLEPESTGSFVESGEAIRWWEILLNKLLIEGNAIETA